MPERIYCIFTASTKQGNLLKKESYPLLLNSDGKLTILKPNFKNSKDCELSRNNEIKLKSNDFNTVDFADGETFKLSFWNNGGRK